MTATRCRLARLFHRGVVALTEDSTVRVETMSDNRPSNGDIASHGSTSVHASACEVMPAGNTRSLLSYRPFPTAMARGEGCLLWDVDGNEYLDLCGEYTAGLFGHTEARIHDALRGALANGLNLAAVGQAEQDLARLLCARFPSLDKVRFTNSGTEANLLAITAARAFTGRSHVLVFRGGYHGSVLTFPLAGPAAVTAPFSVIFADYNDIEGTVAVIRAHADSLAAVQPSGRPPSSRRASATSSSSPAS